MRVRVGGPPTPRPTHLRYMSMYGLNASAQHGWVNMLGEGSLAAKLDAYSRWRLPSFFGDLPGGIFERGRGLAPGWEEVLDRVVNESILPHFGPGKALRGVFLGDEICCMNVSCWVAALAPVAARLRAALGPSAVLYTNECAANLTRLGGVPEALDLVSVDVYAGFLPGTQGSEEYERARMVYEQNVFPNLRSHQQVMLVPGVFGCSNTSFYPLEAQSAQIVRKLQLYFEWAREEPRVAGFMPWHFNTRGSTQHPPPCDMCLGAVAMPTVVEQLQEMGRYIMNASLQHE